MYVVFMMTPANGEPGRKPQGRKAWMEEPSRVAAAHLPWQPPPGRITREGSPNTAGGCADSESPLSLFLPVGGAASGQKSQQRCNSTTVLLL